MLYFIIYNNDKRSKVQYFTETLNTKSCTLEHVHLKIKYHS
jgi:hypothetical protein